MPLSLGISGHRPKYWKYSKEASASLVSLVVSHIRRISPDRVITGMALGMDMAAAEASVSLGIPFVAAVPFDGQEATWPQDAQIAYRRLLSESLLIEVVSPGGFSDTAYRKRNEFIVANSHQMLVLHDGSQRSGTGHCIGLAAARSLTITNIWQEFNNLREQPPA